MTGRDGWEKRREKERRGGLKENETSYRVGLNPDLPLEGA